MRAMTDTARRSFAAVVPRAAAGWSAFFAEVTFPGSGTHPLTLTTPPPVVPETLPCPPPVAGPR